MCRWPPAQAFANDSDDSPRSTIGSSRSPTSSPPCGVDSSSTPSASAASPTAAAPGASFTSPRCSRTAAARGREASRSRARTWSSSGRLTESYRKVRASRIRLVKVQREILEIFDSLEAARRQEGERRYAARLPPCAGRSGLRRRCSPGEARCPTSMPSRTTGRRSSPIFAAGSSTTWRWPAG